MANCEVALFGKVTILAWRIFMFPNILVVLQNYNLKGTFVPNPPPCLITSFNKVSNHAPIY